MQMRTISTIILGTAFGLSLYAQTYNMEVVLNNGTVQSYPADEISEVRFVADEPQEVFNILTEEYIPDPELRATIKAQVAMGASELTNVQAAAYAGALQFASPYVTNFKGIEYLSSLQAMYADGTMAKSLDVSMLKDLQVLTLNRCKELTELNLGEAVKLRALNIGGTGLTQFDLSVLPESMAFINVESLEYSELDFTRFKDIEEINCAQNALTLLNVTGLSKLNSLVCSTNQLTELDLQGCDRLSNLVATINYDLKSVNVADCNSLANVYLMYTSISEFDPQPIRDTLLELNLGNTKISSIDLSGCYNLTYLALNDTELSGTPDFSDCIALDELRIENTHITALDVSASPNIHELHCYSIPELKEVTMASELFNLYNLNLFDVAVLENFQWGETKILKYASIYMTGLERLDISKMNHDVMYASLTYNDNLREIKVWPDFDINNPPANIQKDDTAEFVYEFTE